MAKQLNINLGFTADTTQAAQQLKSLQNQLTNLLNSTKSGGLGHQIAGDINQATQAVAELKLHLQNATNINTGTLDFTKLDQSIKKSNMTLSQYGQTLRDLGPAGKQAFNVLAQSVAQSEIPIRRSNAALTEMWTTLKNTARWQISSSILHGFTKTLSSAVGYAKDLNESLNDIRIVTGKSIDDMAKFANQANKSAKALGATTNEYAKASLIYYQQGIESDAKIQQMSDITIKMAKVSGQEAQEVSNQLTAIWNNFDDGTKSLESYADVLAKLGAETASSSDEIAQGLEKFAAIGETVGLSFNNAAAALATVTSETRESAEVVGTAFKTIFARIQGLKLGETLEDGTDLNKYSEGLAKVGIDIKDQNGELKRMDDILAEMGNKWSGLSKDQQAALAQTVAGVRQYNQLMALMNNWDVYEKNLNRANNSRGTLEEQAKIYEESWQAASNRVRTALEDIYQTLINDEGFITILNHIEHFLDYIDNMIDSVGGLSGVLTTLGAILTKVFSAQIAQSITNMATNLKLMSQSGRESYQKERSKTITGFASMMGGTEYSTEEDKAREKYLKSSLLLQQEFIENESKMSELERNGNQLLLDRNRILGEAVIETAKQVDKAKEKQSDAKFQIQTEIAEQANGDSRVYGFENAVFEKAAKGLQGIIQQQEAVRRSISLLGDESLEASEKIEKIKQELVESGMSAKEIEKIEKELEESGMDADILIQKLGKLQIRETKKKTEMVYGYADEEAVEEYDSMRKTDTTTPGTGVTKKSAEEYANAIRTTIRAKQDAEKANEDLSKSEEQVKKKIKDSQGAQKSWADSFVQGANSVLSLVSALQMLGGMADVLSNPDMSGWDKFLSITSTLLMAVPMLITGLTGLKAVMAGLKAITNKDTIAKGLNAAATWLQAKAENALQKEKSESTSSTRTDTNATNANTISKIANRKASKTPSGMKGKVTGKVPSGSSLKGGAGSSIKGSLSSMGSSLGKLAASYGAIAAGILIIVGTIALATNQYNKAANEAKAAAEASIEAADAYGVANDSYNNFMSTVQSYNSAVDQVRELTAGTEEYKEAVIKANEEAMNLLNTYKNLEYTVGEDGLILIDEKSLKNAQAEQEKLLKKQQHVSLMANQNAENKQLAADKKQFARDSLKSDGDIGYVLGNGAVTTLAGAGSGALIGGGLSSWSGPGAIIGAAIGAVVGAIGGIASTIVAGSSAADEEETLDKLAEYYEKNNGQGFETKEALENVLRNELKIEDERLIQSLVDNRQATLDLVKEMSINNQQNKAANKATIDEHFGEEIRKEIKGVNKEREEEIANVASTIMGEELANRKDKQYKDDYKDAWFNKTDAEIQKEYAKAMGWDANLVDNQNGNKAVYIDNQGNEITLSDDVARQYLAEQAALKDLNDEVDEYTNKASTLLAKEKAFAAAADGSIKSYEKYKEQMYATGIALGLTKEQIDEVIKSYGSMEDVAKKQSLSKAIQNWEDANYGEETANKIAEYLTQDMTEEQIQVAVNVATSTDNLEQFRMELEQALSDEFIVDVKASSETASRIVSKGQISEADEKQLKKDKNWIDFLEASGRTQVEFAKKTNSEKIAIVSEYYATLKGLEMQGLEHAKEVYANDLAEYEAILHYKQAKQKGDKETMQGIEEAYQGIDFNAYASMDISDIESKMDQVQQRIDEIDGQQITLDMEWESTETIEKQMENVSELARGMASSAKKVGNSYQLTAAQAKDWMKVYPDLFETATVTSEGLISLNGEVVDDYIQGQQDSTDAAIDANITQLESRISQLEAEKEASLIELELAKAMAEGKMELEGATKEYLAETRGALVQHYIECGMDEVSANKAALDTMGLNEEEYSRLVAEANSRNADNQAKSAELGATAQTTVLGKLWDKFKSFFSNVGKGFAAIVDVIAGKKTWSDVWDAFTGKGEKITADVDTSSITGYDANGNFLGGEAANTARTATLKEIGAKRVEDITNRIASIDERIGNMRNEILYNEALKKQGLDDYGSTDPKDLDDDGSDSSSSNKKKVEELEEILERYHEINREVGLLERELDRLGKATDKAWGPKKLAAMDEEIKTMEKLAGKYSDLYKAQLVYLAADEQNIRNNFTGANIDKNTGEILNYTELEQQALDEYQAAVDKYNASAQTDDDKEALDKAKNDYEEKIGYLEQYEETLDAANDSYDKVSDMLDSIAEKRYDKIMYSIEFKVEVNDRELKKLDSEISRIEDDFYKTSEVMAKIQSKTKFYDDSDTGILNELQNAQKELTKEFEAGKITQAQYIEGLQQIQDRILDNIDALYEMNREMQAYYSDTLDAGIQKIKDMSSHFDHLTSKLQHYQNMVNLLGQEQNYDMQNKLLQSQIEILNDKIETSKNTMAMLEENLAWAQDRYNKARTKEEKEEYLKRIQAISQALEEEEEAYLGYVEKVAEAANQILTNSIEKAFKNIADEMTNNLGYDAILDSMDRLNTLSEEFLTNTNKMYETNKLIGKAQQTMNKTQNLQAKKQYQDYIKYIEQLQISGNLTQTELKVAQARYKVLEAEIALEEAKNAKSEVRLTRDIEGNFGYVYTANQDNIYNAQQGYLDAQNELYNIGLDTSNGYRQKIVELQQQTLEDLKQLEIDYRVNHLMSEEEYEQRKLAIIETSQEALKIYQEQYNLGQQIMFETQYDIMEQQDGHYYDGLQNIATETREAIDEVFNGKINSLSYDLGTTFKNNLETALGDCKEATDLWQQNMQPVVDAVGVSFNGDEKSGKDGLSQKIDKTLASSKLLSEYLNKKPGGLIDSVEKELDAVQRATEKWDAHWKSLDIVIGKYEDLYKLTGIEIDKAKTPDIPPGPGDTNDTGTDDTDDTGTSDTDDTGTDATGTDTGGTDATGTDIGGTNTGVLTPELIDTLATRMIRGDFGNGKQNRIAALQKEFPWMTEADYQIIQDEVNRRAPFGVQVVVQQPVVGDSDDFINNENIKDEDELLKFSENEAYQPGDVNEVFEDPTKVFPDIWDETYTIDNYSPGDLFDDTKATSSGSYSGDLFDDDKKVTVTVSVSSGSLFDTGGYTGNWGPEGKLAVLHEKELVLNKQDTENFLIATSILREISDMLDNNALIASLGAINLSAMNINSPADQVLQQEVNIHADFPNVVDHNEIEIAIDNLINAASQHAYRQ